MSTTQPNTPPLVLKGMTWDHPRGLDGLVESDSLLREQLGVTVEWEARSLLAFGDQHIVDFAPQFDLMVIDHPHVPDAVEGGALLALDEHLPAATLADLQRESVGFSHDSYNYRGHQWGLATDAAAQVSAYRPDLADGTPPYWSDILALAAQGKVIWPYKPVDAFSTFATLLAQRGAPLASADLYLDQAVAVEVLETMIELATLVPDWCATANPIDAAEALAGGTDFSHAVALYGYTNYSRRGFRDNLIAYDDIPSFDGRAGGATLGGAGLSVSASTQHPELAAQAASLLSGARAQSGSYTEHGGQPGNLRAWKSASLNELTNNFFSKTLRTLERAWVRPRVLGWPDLQFAISQIVHEALVQRRIAPDTIARLEELPAIHLKEKIQ